MTQLQMARNVANQFVTKHRPTFGEVDEKQVNAAVEKIARVLNGMQVAQRKAERVKTAPSSSAAVARKA
jgi:hypothetical protein